MSFSSDVKNELLKQDCNARHCQLAELSAIFEFCGTFVQKKHEKSIIFFNCENDLVGQKTFTLLKKAFNIYSCVDEKEDLWTSEESSQKIFIEGENALKIYDAVSSHLVTQKTCCKRAYLRGAYLCGGSVSDPGKSYHLEIVCKEKSLASKIKTILNSFDVDAKITMRKEHYIVYIKDSSQIVETLNIVGSPVALMEFENTIILKEMRNSINRRNNCDTANITKTVSAAVRQIEDIKLVMNHPEYKNLPASVKEMAEIRLEYPEASLKELGEYANPPLGKSGVNHRLRKLSELAEKYRGAIL